MRSLEREISNVCRKLTRRVVKEGKEDVKVEVTPANVNEFLGILKFREIWADKKNEIGLATGLAWTEVGGQVLATEATMMEGKGRLTLTGKLGDVMQESAQAAMSYVRSRTASLGLPRDFYRHIDIHMHVPEGAIPKDGPSAGITICTTHCQRAHAHSGTLRRGHDRRNHAARQSAAHRRREGKTSGGAPRGHSHRDAAQG